MQIQQLNSVGKKNWGIDSISNTIEIVDLKVI